VSPNPDAFPRINLLDHYRIALADELARLTGITDRNVIFSGLDRAPILERGDLVLAVPRLRIKGGSPIELCQKLAREVSLLCSWHRVVC
jgi:arginyl-tRNA synthetase